MNIKYLKVVLTGLLFSCLAVACTAKRVAYKAPSLPKKTIMAIGYGTVEAQHFTTAQRRLMGMRASKVEAYRALVEQIYGVHVNSHATVENMAAKSDQIRAHVDAIVRGARIKRITAIDADTYETVMEVELTPQFFECFNASEKLLNSCLEASSGLPVSSINSEQSYLAPVAQRAACNSSYCYNYPDMQGFTLAYSRPNYAVEMLQETSKQFWETPVQLYDGMMATAGYQ